MLPTGGGKSICFQVPALVLGGITLVISPLIALMNDQVEGLKKRGIRAIAIHSGYNREEVKQWMENALQGHYQMIYLSPERLASDNFREYLPNLPVNMLVVDEAHCISMWGQDFRPAYRWIKEIYPLLKSPIIAAFTASAPSWIQDDILQQLQLQNPFVFRGEFHRSNLNFHCVHSENKNNYLLRLLQKNTGSALVFSSSRKEVEENAKLLSAHGIAATFYHAGLSNAERQKRQSDWTLNKFPVMCCTNAFGMGVDKPDVRLVVHTRPPKNPEDYYQEAGRAGRDGKESFCVLLYQQSDWREIEQQLREQHPDSKELERLYHATANFLQISPGHGDIEPLPISMEGISVKYGFTLKQTVLGLKALEVCGQIQLLEGGYMPSRIQFIAPYSEVYDFRIQGGALAQLVDVLLRQHGGIFEQPTVVNEFGLSKKLRLTEMEITSQLTQLQQRKMIRYWPQSQLPRLIFLGGRSMYPSINDKPLKELLARRLESIQRLRFYAEQPGCRSIFWQTHFAGESNYLACGKCDYCKKNRIKSTPENFNTSWIIQQIDSGALTVEALLNRAPIEFHSHCISQIRNLMDEGIVIKSPNGELSKSNR